MHVDSGIGAGIDSIFEYMLKAYILFGKDEYLKMFEEAYASILKHVRDAEGEFYRVVHMNSGHPMANWMDSLGAFFPGLQVLYGDLDSAIRLHALYFSIWRSFG